MYLKSMILFAIGAAAHSGWKIPPGQPDGVYKVTENADGTFDQTLLPTYSSRSVPMVNSAKFARSLTSRQANIVCAGYAFSSHSSVDISFHNLQYQCDYYGPVGGNRDYYSISGDVVTYFCNFGGGSTTCSSGEAYNVLVGGVTGACGSYWAGWGNPINRPVSYGYESVSRDKEFCGQNHGLR